MPGKTNTLGVRAVEGCLGNGPFSMFQNGHTLKTNSQEVPVKHDWMSIR